MITSAAASALTIPFVSGLLKKAGEFFGDIAVKAIGEKIATNNIYKVISDSVVNRKYTENLVSKVFTFRTITSGDKDVYLDQVYYPLHVSSYKYKDVLVCDNETLENERRICLVGVAGQGKTMTLKKMFLEDLNKKQYFPIFISLRNIDFTKNISLPEIIENNFVSNGIECTKSDVANFLKSTAIRMYFDGFDEIPYNQRKNALLLLDECELSWSCSVVCSTRPDTELCKFAGFMVYNLKYLKENDVRNMIDMIVVNPEANKQLITILEEKTFLYESIITPILVDIFIVTSFGLGKDSENITSYYESLFSSLTYKHDYNKFFSRQRLSELNDIQLENCFTYLSFVTHLQQKTTLSRNDCLAIVKESLSFIGRENENEINVMSDICDITNLLVNDGYNSISFIHKSIQDFYAARFLSKRPDDYQNEFWGYDFALPDKNFCYMCSCLNTYNYYLYFVPKLLSYCDCFSNLMSLKYITREDIISYSSTLGIQFETEGFSNPRLMFTGRSESISRIDTLEEVYSRIIFNKDFIHPYGIIYDFCIKNNKLIDEKLSLRANRKYLSRATVYFSEMSFDSFLHVFDEFNETLDLYLNILNGYIDEIWQNYQKQKNMTIGQEQNAKLMMNSLMNRAKSPFLSNVASSKKSNLESD